MDNYRGVDIGNVIDCEGGYLVTSNYFTATAYDKAGKVVKEFRGTDRHMQNFVDVVRSRKTEELYGPIEEGNTSSALCHLGNISHRLGGLNAMYKVRPFGDNEDAADTYDRFKEHMNANGVQPDNTQVFVGKTLTVDAKRERFVDDSEADKMLTREYRKPFVVPDAV